MPAGQVPAPQVTAPQSAAPQVRCTVEDPRLDELSGLVADTSGLWAIADSGRRIEVHRIDPATCAVVESRTVDVDPADTEDLARGPDGSLWVGDIGDNERRRRTIAVIVLPAQGKPVLHRLSYPDGPHDAEALLVDAAGRPVVVTKEGADAAGIYRTEAPPDGIGPTPLVRVGEVALPPSDTAGGPIGGLGSLMVTGAAESADGRVVALRSYTDAWLYRVPDGPDPDGPDPDGPDPDGSDPDGHGVAVGSAGDVAAALTGRPVRVPLPGEPQGEAIAFEQDGTLISGSETRGGVAGQIRFVPNAAALAASDTQGDTQAAPDPVKVQRQPMPEWLPAAIGAGVAVAILLLGMSALAIRAARRRR